MGIENIFRWKPQFIGRFLGRKKIVWLRKWLPIERIGGLIMIAAVVVINPWLAFLAITGITAVFFSWIKKALDEYTKKSEQKEVVT